MRISRALEISLIALVLLVGAVMSYVSRFAVGPDAVSYLDIADGVARGQWHAILNAYWSPLYPILQGFALLILHPAPYWESSVVHGVHFLLYALSLFVFRWLWKKIVASGLQPGSVGMGWLLATLGIFTWTTAIMVNMRLAGPDICVVIVAILASAISIKVVSTGANGYTAVALGAVLGLGYLAKTVLLPFGILLLVCLFFKVDAQRKRMVVGAAIVFTMIALPFIIGISLAKHRLTIGDSSRLNYVWFVNYGAENLVSEPQMPSQRDRLLHPVRRISTDPVAYEFRTPIKATYPFWYDPSYWLEGLSPKPTLRGEIHALRTTIGRELRSKFQTIAVPLFLLLLWACRNRRDVLKKIAGYWYLLLPCIGILFLYALVALQYRYLGPFFLVIASVAFGAAFAHGDFSGRRIPVVVGAIMLVTALVFSAMDIHRTAAMADDGHQSMMIANRLHEFGLRPGDEIAMIGDSQSCYWARLAGLRIIAEVPIEHAADFWNSDRNRQIEVERLLQQTGAKAIVSDRIPAAAAAPNWQSLSVGSFHVYFPMQNSITPR